MPRPDRSIMSDFVSGIMAAESVSDGFRHFSGAVETLGFGAATYTAIPLTLGAAERLAPVFLASSEFSRGFLAHYEEAGFVDRDFTIERARRGRTDVMDWREESVRGRLTDAQTEVVDIARFEHGMRGTMTIPTLSDAHVIAGVSVAGDEEGDRFERLKRERLETLGTLSGLFHQWVFAAPARRVHFYSDFLERLSADEVKVIKLVIGGHRLKLSQDLCGISPTRAGNLLSSLYRKLGISNASELAYLVGLHQIDRLL